MKQKPKDNPSQTVSSALSFIQSNNFFSLHLHLLYINLSPGSCPRSSNHVRTRRSNHVCFAILEMTFTQTLKVLIWFSLSFNIQKKNPTPHKGYHIVEIWWPAVDTSRVRVRQTLSRRHSTPQCRPAGQCSAKCSRNIAPDVTFISELSVGFGVHHGRRKGIR